MFRLHRVPSDHPWDPSNHSVPARTKKSEGLSEPRDQLIIDDTAMRRSSARVASENDTS